jgi:uncharacterized repeat protein (TIGR04138 family)
MLCANCHEREATVHTTKISVDGASQTDLCAECAGPPVTANKSVQLREILELLKAGTFNPGLLMKKIIAQNFRYSPEAYEFVVQAFDACPGETQVSGHDLLKAIRELALQKFRQRAKAALADWKIFKTEDFGEIVFDLVEAGLLAKHFEFIREEFQAAFNFDSAFPEN